MTSESQLQAVKTYRERMKEKGLMYVQVWVPVEKVDQVKEYAKKLRKED